MLRKLRRTLMKERMELGIEEQVGSEGGGASRYGMAAYANPEDFSERRANTTTTLPHGCPGRREPKLGSEPEEKFSEIVRRLGSKFVPDHGVDTERIKERVNEEHKELWRKIAWKIIINDRGKKTPLLYTKNRILKSNCQNNTGRT